MCHIGRSKVIYTVCDMKPLKERDHSEDLRLDGRIIGSWKCVILVVCAKTGKDMWSNTTTSIKTF